MGNIYDVAVIGAGPAGSAAARVVAGHGASVLLVDKALFPRRKPCAGALPPSALSHVPFRIDTNNATRITTAILGSESVDEVVYSGPETLGWTVDRRVFDALLVEKAIAAGAVFFNGKTIREIHRRENGWAIAADDEVFRSRFVVGADGAAGIVGRRVGHSLPIERAVCIEASVEVPASRWTHGPEVVKFDFGWVDSGYAWVFAKEGHYSVGVYSTCPMSGRSLRRDLAAFIDAEPLVRGGRVSNVKRWFVPRGVGQHRDLHFDGGLLVGDAAGLADPLTGEGIRHALLSGRIAGEVLVKCLEVPRPSLQQYSKEIDQALRPAFRIARVCAAIAFRGRGRLVGRFVRSGFAEGPWGRLARSEVPYPRVSWGLLAAMLRWPWRRPLKDHHRRPRR
jgi:geranylgeranyl reductase family protein